MASGAGHGADSKTQKRPVLENHPKKTHPYLLYSTITRPKY